MTQDPRVEQFIASFQALRGEVEKVIVGHREIIDHVLIGMFAGGHVLLEGVPGLGKTLLIKTLAEGLELSFSRVRALTRVAEPTVTTATPPSPAAPVVRPVAKPAAAQNGAASTVYRSGVIDGMAYTLFMDGSIQAELPQGTVRFGNIDDLQKYLLGNR